MSVPPRESRRRLTQHRSPRPTDQHRFRDSRRRTMATSALDKTQTESGKSPCQKCLPPGTTKLPEIPRSSPLRAVPRRSSRPQPATRSTVLRRSEEHTSELQSRGHLVCRLLLEKKKKNKKNCT